MASDGSDGMHRTPNHTVATNKSPRKVERSSGVPVGGSDPEGADLAEVAERVAQLTGTIAHLCEALADTQKLVKALVPHRAPMVLRDSTLRQAVRRLSTTRLDGAHRGDTRIIDWDDIGYIVLPRVRPTPGVSVRRTQKVFATWLREIDFDSELPVARTADGVYKLHIRTLEEIERVSPVPFVRIGQSVLVNLAKVETDSIRGQNRRDAVITVKLGSTQLSSVLEELVVGEGYLDALKYVLGHGGEYPERLREQDEEAFGAFSSDGGTGPEPGAASEGEGVQADDPTPVVDADKSVADAVRDREFEEEDD